jgi:putative glutathione S-transferase
MSRSDERPDQFSTRGAYVTSGAEFDRDTNYIEDRIVRDTVATTALSAPPPSKVGVLGQGISQGATAWPVEPGRYRLIAANACPWANRTVIVRRLLGLEDAISLGRPGPTHDARSWTFDLDPSHRDPVLGTERLQENYFKRFAGYPRGITVPAIVDIAAGRW